MKKYEVVLNDLRTRILNKEFKSTCNKLPTENDLAAQYNVSKITIKKAISILKEENIIRSIQGSGMFVNNSIDDLTSEFINKNIGFQNSHKGLDYTTVVFKFNLIPPSKEIQKALQLEDNIKVFEVFRIRIIDSIPQLYEQSYYPENIIPNLTADICANSIFDYIQNTLELQIWKSNDLFSIDNSSDLDYVCLNIKPESKVVVLQQIVKLVDNRIIQYSITRQNPDYFRYKTVTKFLDT